MTPTLERRIQKCLFQVRSGQIKKPSGYQADLICLTPWVNGEAPTQITCLTVNSAFGLIAYGNGSGTKISFTFTAYCEFHYGEKTTFKSRAVNITYHTRV